LQVCELLRDRLREYNDLLSFNAIFYARTRTLGVITADEVSARGITGPSARAAGVGEDVRRYAPYAGYALDDTPLVGLGAEAVAGGAHARFLQRFREVHESIAIVREALGRAAEGKDAVQVDVREIPAGESYVRVEGPRGAIGCYVVSDGGEFPTRVQFTPPSLRALTAVPSLLRGTRLEDLRLLLASLDLSISEVDR
jgi:NADH-quinone oxidoreductase subunit D